MTQEIDLEKYHQLALQKQKEHRKFLASLKKKPPKNLDKIAQQIHDEVFEEIDCTACANCCKTLGPDFKEADIVRIAKYFKMKLPAFEEEFLQVDEDGDKVFKAMPCPFFRWRQSLLDLRCPSKGLSRVPSYRPQEDSSD